MEAGMIDNHVSFPLLPTDGSAEAVMPSLPTGDAFVIGGPAGSFKIRFILEHRN
jgi:hypothetical protein